MKPLEFLWADVFTTEPFRGNPCAVFFEADGLPSSTMLQIARETNLSETVFVTRGKNGNWRPYYFTPREEIPLAGHPTIATVHALLETGRLPEGTTSLTLELTAGAIQVQLEGSGRIVMEQLPPRFLRRYESVEIMPLFGLEPSDALPGAPIQTVSTGTPMLMVPLKNQDVLRRASLQVEKFRRHKEKGDYFSPHLFCLQGISPEALTFARHFGLPPDTLEDPFTGSASGAMAAYLWRHGLIQEPRFLADQGHWMGRPGQAELEVIGPRDRIETVRLKGTAVTVLTGKLAFSPFKSASV